MGVLYAFRMVLMNLLHGEVRGKAMCKGASGSEPSDILARNTAAAAVHDSQ